MLATLTAQILQQIPGLPVSIQELYDKKMKTTAVSFTGILDLLNLALSHFKKVFWIVDALDDISAADREMLVERITDFYDSKYQKISLLFSSRKEGYLSEIADPDRMDVIECPIEAADVNPDIQRYIENRMKHERRLTKLSAEIKEKVRSKLMEGTCGMYVMSLLALCQKVLSHFHKTYLFE